MHYWIHVHCEFIYFNYMYRLIDDNEKIDQEKVFEKLRHVRNSKK